MALLRYLARAIAWSLPLCALWLGLAPVTRALLEAFTQLFLALAHASQPLAQRAHLGPMLFLALFLAAKPRGQRAVVYGALGVLACVAAQGLTTALLLTVGDEHRLIMRLLRDWAIAADKIAPLAAALLLVPRTRGRRAGADTQAPVSARRRERPALRRRRSRPQHPPLHPDRP